MSDYSWVKEMRPAFVQLQEEAGRGVAIEKLRAQGGEPFNPIQFYRTERVNYIGEVGKKGEDLIFHFFGYPGMGFPSSFKTLQGWEDVMGDAFITVFKYPDKIEAIFSDELKSWAVRVRGYANNPSADALASKLFEALDTALIQT